MTPRPYIMKFGGIVLSVATFVVIGVSFSDEVLSQIGRSATSNPGGRPVTASGGGGIGGAAQDPGVRFARPSTCPGGMEPPCMLDGLTGVE